jgi:hypothetical protein
VTVAALVHDLMDRSRLDGVVDVFVRSADALATVDAEVVVVDLGAAGAVDAIAALVGRGVRVVGYGSHVDTEILERARQAGALALPRSRFFADPTAAVAADHPG